MGPNGTGINGTRGEGSSSSGEGEEELTQFGLYKVSCRLCFPLLFSLPLSLAQVKEKVDARDTNMGAWFEAEVVKVTAEDPGANSSSDEPVIHYHVKFDE